MEELPIHLDFRNKAPIHEQLRAQIQHLIEGGVLDAGEQLPTVRALADQLQVNFNTIARAYRALDQAGYINTRQGRGTYVIERKPQEESSGTLQFKPTLEEVLNEKAVEFCRAASAAGLSLQEIQRIIARQMRQGRKIKHPATRRPMRKVAKKRAVNTLFEPAPSRPKRNLPIKRISRRQRK